MIATLNLPLVVPVLICEVLRNILYYKTLTRKSLTNNGDKKKMQSTIIKTFTFIQIFVTENVTINSIQLYWFTSTMKDTCIYLQYPMWRYVWTSWAIGNTKQKKSEHVTPSNNRALIITYEGFLVFNANIFCPDFKTDERRYVNQFICKC